MYGALSEALVVLMAAYLEGLSPRKRLAFIKRVRRIARERANAPVSIRGPKPAEDPEAWIREHLSDLIG